MNSIAKDIDGPTIAAQIRMERQKHKGAFLLLEGANDARRFAQFIDESVCSVVIAYGKANAVAAVELLHDDGFVCCLGMIDADFDRVLGKLPNHEGLIPSETHDFDLDAATTRAFERYIQEVGDTSKVEMIGGPRSLLDSVLKRLKPITALRFANVKHNLGYSLNGMKLDEFFDGSTVDVDAMISNISRGGRASPEARAALRRHIDRYAASNIDLYQATSGHDFCEALGIMLRDVVGDRRAPQTWRSEVERHFRLAYNREHFAETQPCRLLQAWEAGNPPYRVLRTGIVV